MVRIDPSRALHAILACAIVVATAQPVRSATLVNGLGGPAGYGTHRLDLSDNGSSPSIDVTPAFPTGLLYLGTTYIGAYVNNNGNLTFGAALAAPTPIAFPVPGQRMLAAWWGDVDTRGGTLADSTQDAVFWDVRSTALTVTWHNVGFFDTHDELQNDFQLIVRAPRACRVSDFELEVRYHQCQWVSGSASGGVHGHGGTAAEAGFDGGDGVHFYAFPGSLSESVTSLCSTSNVGEPGVWRVTIHGSDGCFDRIPCDTGLLGACASGTTRCMGGVSTCVQTLWPSPERCDGFDNNCDGMVDNPPAGSSLCPSGDLCAAGECSTACFDGACLPGQACADAGVCVDPACRDVMCATGQRCRGGTCVDACAGVRCPLSSLCRAGACLTPCEDVACTAGQVCDQGACGPPCDCGSCGAGYACASDGTCQPSDCIGLVCPPGQLCASAVLGQAPTSAMCVDACMGVVCPMGQYCDAARCVWGVDPQADAGAAHDGGSSLDDARDADAFTWNGDVRNTPIPLGARPTGTCRCAVPASRGHGGARGVGALCIGAIVQSRRRRRS